MGRMGREIAALCGDMGFTVAAGADVKGGEAAFPLYASLALCTQSADVLLDFSRAGNLPEVLRYATAHSLPCVIGTTGLGEAQRALLRDAAKHIPVCYAENFSPGAHALKQLAVQAGALLPAWDIEIIERHHRGKPDAPGGTAMALYAALSGAQSAPVYGRHAAHAARGRGEIGIHAVRGGTVPGTHEAGFYGQEESLALVHITQSRAVFARGALRAAAFVLKRPAGLYGMEDMMGDAP